MKTMAKVVTLCLVAFGVPLATSTQVDLRHPEVWRTVQEAPTGVTYPVLALTRVIDGDTFEAWVHIAPRLAYFADVRVAGVDAPEVAGRCKEKGFEAKAKVEDVLRKASKLTIRVTDVDQYGRWVAVVEFDGQDLATWIRVNRLTKADLCP